MEGWALVALYSWVILPHSPCELGKFSWAILGWLKKIIILGDYYPIEPSSDLTNIGQLFLLKYVVIIAQLVG